MKRPHFAAEAWVFCDAGADRYRAATSGFRVSLIQRDIAMDSDLVPPIELIVSSNVGVHDKENIADEYIRIGNYMLKVLQQDAHLNPESHVLDVGCGPGRVARAMSSFLTTGAYIGIDIKQESIDWCRKKYDRLGNLIFIISDIYSKWYNPDGTIKAENYRFPFKEGYFDIVFSSSLFTHMLIDAVDNYLREMSRATKPGGYVWNTYLLLDEASEPLVIGPRPDGRRMQYSVDGGRIGYLDKPEHVVGLHKERILEIHQKHGLEIVHIRLSNWSGGRPQVAYRGQDVIIARKPL